MKSTTTNKELITAFYRAFSVGDAAGMVTCYAEDVTFRDPAFGQLRGKDVGDMWRMLLSREGSTPEVQLVGVNDDGTEARWWARYNYGKGRRPVLNEVTSSFTIREGKITQQTDSFSLWRWSRQALGLTGLLLGWTPLLRNRIQATTRSMLTRFQELR